MNRQGEISSYREEQLDKTTRPIVDIPHSIL